MTLANIHNVYFIGIGGIGMSALARWFNHHGYPVSGYDRTETALTQALVAEGIAVHYADEVGLIPQAVKDDKAGSLVIYTPAIPAQHSQKQWLQQQGYELYKRSQVLGMFTENMHAVAVAGTHGKTTTSSILAHILKDAGYDLAAFMGGISTNYHTNVLINQVLDESTIGVVEADEYDRSFLRLHPNMAIVTSVDADHLDIYGDRDSLKTGFRDFLGRVTAGGDVLMHYKVLGELFACTDHELNIYTYGIGEGDCQAVNLHIADGAFAFDYQEGTSGQEELLEGFRLQLPGHHNVENAVAAIAMAIRLGVGYAEIISAINSYKGVKRRFEYRVRKPGVVYIDDYAHHPSEIAVCLNSVRALYPDKRLTVVFQPHLYTRTRDFAEGFSQSLSLADELFLMDIYPAREEPIPGISSDMLMEGISAPVKQRVSKANLLETLKGHPVEVLVTLGAGDIDQFVEPLQSQLLALEP